MGKLTEQRLRRSHTARVGGQGGRFTLGPGGPQGRTPWEQMDLGPRAPFPHLPTTNGQSEPLLDPGAG